jgi:N-acetylglucosamine-6-phosphate deacetylase
MDAAVRFVVEACGVPLGRALQSASAVPAALLGLRDRGVLAPGRRADLVALGPDLRVEAVWAGGAPCEAGAADAAP